MEVARQVTMPELMKILGVKRATLERLVVQYGDRIGPMVRYGVVRCWSANSIDVLRSLISEERRLQEARR